MLIEPAYPNAASDPRLTNVHAEYKRLRNLINDKEWHCQTVTPADRAKYKHLRELLDAGKFYTPNF